LCRSISLIGSITARQRQCTNQPKEEGEEEGDDRSNRRQLSTNNQPNEAREKGGCLFRSIGSIGARQRQCTNQPKEEGEEEGNGRSNRRQLLTNNQPNGAEEKRGVLVSIDQFDRFDRCKTAAMHQSTKVEGEEEGDGRSNRRQLLTNNQRNGAGEKGGVLVSIDRLDILV
jgi:hypothetical protein